MQVEAVSYESMIENAMDPSHAPFLHGKSALSTGDDFVPMRRMSVLERPSAEGFTLAHGGYTPSNDGMNATRTFIAPSFVDADYSLPGGGRSNFKLLFSPRAAGETLTLLGLPIATDVASKLPRWLPARQALGDLAHALFLTSRGLWRFHDQDQYAMQGQDRAHASEPERRQEAWDVLTPSDLGVSTFHKWLNAAGGGPFGGARASASAAVPEEYNAWHAHVKHCPQCLRALRIVERARALAGALALASSCAAVGALALFHSQGVALHAAALALVLYGVASAADLARGAFFGQRKELWLPSVYTDRDRSVGSAAE
jgi:phenylpropionate dioxygenase-like ring-hydroxylating dioxygenase large terminal subunit